MPKAKVAARPKRANPYQVPSTRPLRVYAFDPSVGRKLNNYMTVKVPFETLTPGPVGAQLAIVDYDASNERYYDPVDLDHPVVLMNSGLDPSESDPRFHQQMVYAVASDTVRRFEFALGRSIRWRTMPGQKRNDPFHGRLRIFPHAFQGANAFYDPELRSVLFGYFSAGDKDPGTVLPGQTVFTCLSHDIVAHELTHALIDGQREYLTEATGPDAAAFHEAFADLVALFQHFTYREALLDTIQRSGGMIYQQKLTPLAGRNSKDAQIIPELSEDNPLVGLAQQFGQSMGNRSALRSAIGTPPNSRRLDDTTEPHLRGSIMVAAVFDAFFTVYIKRTRDLFSIARASGSPPSTTELHPLLAERLAGEASKLAEAFLNICIRGLDYCPPVDMQLGEFLRAALTADADLVPDDPYDYRAEAIKAFRLRGIIPPDISSFSEDSLRWQSPEATGHRLPPCVGLNYGPLNASTDVDTDEWRVRNTHNARVLNAFAKKHAAALGLDRRLPIQPHSFHPTHRVAPTGRLAVDFVVEFLQQRTAMLDPKTPGSPTFSFRGGSTVIFDERGNVRYVIQKNVNNEARLRNQRSFHIQQLSQTPLAPQKKNLDTRTNFRLLHQGMP